MSLSSLEQYLLLIVIYLYLTNFVLITFELRDHKHSTFPKIVRDMFIDIFMALFWIIGYPTIVYKFTKYMKKEFKDQQLIKMLREVAIHERKKRKEEQRNETQRHGRSDER